MRRSSRRVKPRGEREFLVSSDMLLRDLKVMVRTSPPNLNTERLSLDNGDLQSGSIRPESHGERRISHRKSSHSRPAKSPARKSDIPSGKSE